MPLGEVFLGAFLQVAFDRLASPELLDFARRWKIVADLIKLKKTLSKIMVVIGDAETKQIKNQLVRMWLDEVKDIVYDAEDVLDEFEAESLRCKLESAQSLPCHSADHHGNTTTSQVWERFTSSFTSIPSAFSFNMEIKSKIDEITERLEDVAKEKNDLRLIEGTVEGSSFGAVKPRLPTSSLINEPCVYGRDKDVEEVIQLLLSDDEAACNNNNNNVYCVVPVVGPGGIGKTTFAQVLYNDQKVKKYFDMRAWVCVSYEFDVVRITKAIIESTTGNPCGLKELSPLHDRLKELLEEKKFLLVLDDVWNEDYDAWMVLITPFRAGAKGSKVIVTTQSHKVSSITGTMSSRHLELLSDEDCYSLFKQHAFANQNYSDNAHSNLENIGKEIVKKCKGLPLAVKSLGGLLRSKQKEDEWKKVLNNEIWDLLDYQKSELLPALRLSYYHLPSHLKPCFLYCAIFPKGYEFEKEGLVLLWMAQGFVLPNKNNNERMEDIGKEYFHELVWRSFFQESSKGKSTFIMHDLINDLARVVSGETCFTMGDDEQSKKQLSKKTRHLSYWRRPYELLKRFEAFHEETNLRTLISFGAYQYYLPSQIPKDLLLMLTRLRVLCLKQYSLDEIPESICNLVHLRYLDLSYTHVRRLPESVNALYHLQTLLLEGCNLLIELPSDIGNLINLRHLEIDKCYELRKMSRGIGGLTELQTLKKFIVSENNGPRIEELKDLKHLGGRLEISGLENVRDPILMDINLRNKKYLHKLCFKWDDSSLVNDSQVKSAVDLVFDRLQPHTNLKELTVIGYSGTRFPSWLDSPSNYSNLVILHLSKCKNCKFLPPFGQLPSLEELEISEMQGVQKVGHEFYGHGSNNKPFRSLKRLVFSQMPEWEEWTGVGQEGEEFPCLKKLTIQYCPKLGTSSPCFPEIVELKIYSCGELTAFSRVGNLEEREEFPRLRELSISGCPKLREFPKLTSSSMVRLEIIGCQEPAALPNRQLTSLNRLTLHGCDNELLHSVVPFTVPTILRISGISSLTCLVPHEESFLPCLKTLETVDIDRCQELTSLWSCKQVVGGGLQQHYHHLTSLRRLTISGCHQLVSLSSSDSCGGWGKIFPGLEYLRIKDCPGIDESLFSVEEEMELPSMLRHISIIGCTNLQSLPEVLLIPNNNSTPLACLEIKGCSSLSSFSRRSNSSGCSSSIKATNTTNLKNIWIEGCDNLESLPEGLHNLTSLERLTILKCSGFISLPDRMHCLGRLEYLRIQECPRLLCFPQGGLPSTNLRHLEIKGCKDLKSLPDQMNLLTSIEKLEISECPSLLSFPEGGLPSANLKRLEIKGCKDLKSLPDQMNLLTSLEKLKIWECPSLLSFPERGLPSAKLRSLFIHHCDSLKFLPNQMPNNLSSLGKLRIRNCSSLIMSFLEVGFFPSNLDSLDITNDYNSTDLLPLLSQWEMQFYRLTSLTTLSLTGYKGVESLPEWSLPSTLTHLSIENFPHLKSLSKGIQHLTSLQFLSISYCPKFASLPKVELRTTLFQLKIHHCPLLKQWFEKLRREDCQIFSKIHIIVIDGYRIYDILNMIG